jgi:molecular chaperone DnaK (HSP70)
MTPPEISALILRKLKDQAESALQRPVKKAVVTVPAYFDDAQRQATRDAGAIAGLEVVRILNEPTAAALAYGLGLREQLADQAGIDPAAVQKRAESELSTSSGDDSKTSGLSLSLAASCPSGEESTAKDSGQSQASESDESLIAVYDLGGGTFDVSILRLYEGVFEVLSTNGDTTLGGDDLDREVTELIYREVREQFSIDIDSPSTKQAVRTLAENIKIRLTSEASAEIEIDLGESRTFRRTITRDEFEGLIDPWIDRTLECCRRAIRDAGVSPQEFDQVIVVGGTTRIPRVRRRVAEQFQREPYTALNPDEVVALGAAVQAAVLSGEHTDALLLDVIPLSLGIETMGGAMGKLILRNTRIPCQATERFSTFVDGQTSIKINVLQGERELAKDCRSLGEFELRGLPPMPAGIPKLLVTFLVDENGILSVTALEERSRKQASIQIVPAHGLTKGEVEQMTLESYQHAREDMDAHRMIDLRNQIVFDTSKAEQMLSKVGEELEPGERESIEADMAELRRLGNEGNDPEAIHQALDAFDKKTTRLAELAITSTLKESQ